MNTMKIQSDQIIPYQMPVDEILAAFGTDARNGLSEKKAHERLNRYGKNELMYPLKIRW